MSETREALEPCPFCKSLDVHLLDDKPPYIVECGGCGAIGPTDDTAELTIAAWNRRASDERGEERERCAKIADSFGACGIAFHIRAGGDNGH